MTRPLCGGGVPAHAPSVTAQASATHRTALGGTVGGADGDTPRAGEIVSSVKAPKGTGKTVLTQRETNDARARLTPLLRLF